MFFLFRLDCFLERLLLFRRENNLPPPVFVGLSLSEQMLDEVPVDEHDM